MTSLPWFGSKFYRPTYNQEPWQRHSSIALSLNFQTSRRQKESLLIGVHCSSGQAAQSKLAEPVVRAFEPFSHEWGFQISWAYSGKAEFDTRVEGCSSLSGVRDFFPRPTWPNNLLEKKNNLNPETFSTKAFPVDLWRWVIQGLCKIPNHFLYDRDMCEAWGSHSLIKRSRSSTLRNGKLVCYSVIEAMTWTYFS